MQQISQTNISKMDNKTRLISVFKSCLNILRDNEGLTGEKALRTMSYLLILKLLEPHFGREINIDEYEYDFTHIEDEMIEKHKNKLLEIFMTNLQSQRNAYGKALLELARKNDRVIALSPDLASSTRIDRLGAKLGENRFFNLGVAEQNAVGVAAGLALEGFIPFCLLLEFLFRGVVSIKSEFLSAKIKLMLN